MSETRISSSSRLIAIRSATNERPFPPHTGQRHNSKTHSHCYPPVDIERNSLRFKSPCNFLYIEEAASTKVNQENGETEIEALFGSLHNEHHDWRPRREPKQSSQT